MLLHKLKYYWPSDVLLCGDFYSIDPNVKCKVCIQVGFRQQLELILEFINQKGMRMAASLGS